MNARRIWKFGAMAALVAAAALGAAGTVGAYPLGSVSLEGRGDETVLTVEANGSPAGRDIFLLEDPWRVVVDLFGADAPVAVQGPAATGVIRTVRSSIWRDDPSVRIVRYVLEGSGPLEYLVEATDNGFEVHVRSASASPTTVPAAEATPSESEIPETPPEVAPPTVTEEAPVPFPMEETGDAAFVDEPPAAPVIEITAESLEAVEQPPAAPSPTEASPAESALVEATPVEPSPVDASPAEEAPVEDLTDVAPVSTDTAEVAESLPPLTDAMESTEAVSPTPEVVEDGPEQDSAPPLGAADPAFAPAVTRVALGSTDMRPMTLDVQNAEVRGVLRSIAEFGGVNIVPDREVNGPISVRLEEVPWRKALDIVADATGLIAIDQDDYIRVATKKTYREEGIEAESAARRQEDLQPLETRVFKVKYAAAEELKESVSFSLSKRGSAEIDERTNSLLVSDIASRLHEIGRLVDVLDTETRQVEIVARLVDVDKAFSRQIGINWTLDALNSLSETMSGSISVTEPLGTRPSGTVQFGVVRDVQLDATIEALERDNHAELISNPKITTVNNRKARILVGKEVPLIVLDEAGNPVTELKKVGITLEVTPFINDDGRITMDLHPEVSDLSSQATVQGGLIFTTTLADTRVMVKDGDTAVIGGLIRTADIKFNQGVPILRSIPLLGALFRHTETVKENRELLIFVTPRIVEGMASVEP